MANRLVEAQLVVHGLRGAGRDLDQWVQDHPAELPPDISEKIRLEIASSQNDLENKQIFDAQQKLMSVKGQLESLRVSGRVNTEIDRALAALSTITITDAASATQAEAVLSSTAQVAQAEAGGEIQEAMGSLLTGAAAIGSAIFGGLCDKKALAGFKTIANSDAGLQVFNSSGAMYSHLVPNVTGKHPVRKIDQSFEIPA